MKSVILGLLMTALSFAGQSITTTSAQVYNDSFPNIGHSTSYRVEFYIHDWDDAMSSNNYILSNSLGLIVQFHSNSSEVFFYIYSLWDSSWTSVPNFSSLSVKAAYVRIQRDVTNSLWDVEMWDKDGNRFYFSQTAFGTDIAGTSTGLTIGTSLNACSTGFFRILPSLAEMNSRPPVTAETSTRLLEWKFDGDLTDSSGNGYTASLVSGSPTYVTTPYQKVVAKAKTAGAPTWNDWVSLRAGHSNQLDASSSYSQSDASATVTYAWSQSSGPTTLIWDSKTIAKPTVQGPVFGTYTFGLTVTDTSSNTATATLTVGAVATDDNGIVVNADSNADKIFGPMIAFGKNPWGYADYLALTATTQRLSDYQDYGLSTTYPYASWQTAQTGTVSYTWDGVAMYPGISASGTTISSSIASSGIASFTVADISKLDVSELPTRVYVWTSGGSWEEIRVCSVSGSTLTPCYDGRGWADSSNGRIAAQAWSSGAHIGQFKVTGSSTAFLSTLCQAGAQSPVGLVTYSTGTVALTAGSTSVTGTGTVWTSALAGTTIRVVATHSSTSFVFVALVSSVTDSTHLVLSRVYPSDATTGTYSYQLVVTGSVSSGARFPVLHFTRSDGSDAMRYWPNSYGCESDTSLFLNPSWDWTEDATAYTGVNYSYMDGNWWVNQSATGGLNFYGEDLAHRALYLRSGYTPALTAANMIGDTWVQMPMLSGEPSGSALFMGGLTIGAVADAMLSSSGHAVSWSDIRGFAKSGVTALSSSCNSSDSRDTGYVLAWLALAALFDPDTSSTSSPSSGPWRTYWRNQLSSMYTREAGCARSDNSWASGLQFNTAGSTVVLTKGSTAGTGTSISSSTCGGVASGSGTATNGSGVITGSGFVYSSGYRIAITGTKSGSTFTMWQYYTLNSTTQITLNLGATWQGDSGSVTWVIDNTSNALTFGQSNDDSMLAENWSCIWNSATSITLNRAWDGTSGTYYGYVSNIAGIAQQPYMLAIRQSAWRWASLAATEMGDTALATKFQALRTAAGTWEYSTGFDSAVTNGFYYGRVVNLCEPITAASMSGGCYEDNPSNSDYDKVALRELTAENSASLWSYYDGTSGSAAAITWGDLAYGSLWGYPAYTTGGVYAPTDGDTMANTSNSNQSWSGGKWTGFYFGVGMSHQWPAIRQGGVAAESLVVTTIPFTLPSGATKVQVTVTAPSGAVGTAFTCTTSCSATTDSRQGAHWAHLVYQDSSGTTVSTADELLSSSSSTGWGVVFGGTITASGGMTVQR